MSNTISKAISELVLRAALLTLAVPILPVTDEVGSLFRHVSNGLEQIHLPR